MKPSGPVLFLVIIVFLGAVFLIVAANQPDPQSPRQALQKIKDGCEQTYGINSQRSVDCFLTLAKKYASESQRGEYDRIYDKAR